MMESAELFKVETNGSGQEIRVGSRQADHIGTSGIAPILGEPIR